MENENNYKDTYQKAETLMRNALKKIGEKNAEGAGADIALAAKYLKLAEMEVNAEQNNILYGESRNFGIIYTVFENNTNKLFETKNGRKAIKHFVNTIKGDEILREEYNIYNNLKNKILSENITPEEFLDETLSVLKPYTKRQIRESNQKLISLIQKNKMDELIEIDDKTMNLFESIEYLFTNKKKTNNIDEFLNNKKIVLEHLVELQSNPINETVNEDYKDLMNEKILEYSNTLTEDELNLVKELTENEPQSIFENYKNETLKMVNKYIGNSDSEDTARMSVIMETISNKKFNADTIFEDVMKFINIQNTLEED